MRSGLRALVAVFGMALAGIAVWLGMLGGGASAAGASVGAVDLGSGAPAFGNQLVVPGAELILGPEQQAAARAARRASPGAVLARERSRTEFSHLAAAQAAGVAREAFPGLWDEPGGGMPKLPAGARIVGYSGADTAQVSFQGKKRGVLDSLTPIDVESARGRRQPIDLGLHEAGSRFVAKTPLVGVRIPKHLAEGAALEEGGVSLTPVDEHGAALGGAAGVASGAGVFYGDTEDPGAGIVDMDTIVKPNTFGFSTDTVLRSQASPHTLFFRVGLPRGARISKQADGALEVGRGRRSLATIPVPLASDAEGAPVPVQVAVDGDVLRLSVGDATGSYLYPLMVDPTVIDSKDELESVIIEGKRQGNWAFVSTNESGPFELSGRMTDANPHNLNYNSPEYGLFAYETEGESRIYEFESTTINNIEPTLSSTLFITGHSGLESTIQTAGSKNTVCVAAGCPASMGTSSNWGNSAVYKQAALSEGFYKFSASLEAASVYIVQEKGPSAQFVTGPDIGEPKAPANALFGNKWFKANEAGVEFDVKDPGIGVDEYTLSAPSNPEWGFKKIPPECAGVQCPECIGSECTAGASREERSLYSYLNGLPEGEDVVRATAKNATGTSSPTAEATVKIDNSPPHGISVTGLPASAEIGEGKSVFRLTASATDGEGTTPSSGVASIAMSFEGHRIGRPSGYCQVKSGPCTAATEATEWVVNGWEYPAGKDTFTVTATDNAGNVGTYSTTIAVHHASPVALGPGSVDPVTGALSLSATDASIGAGVGASLTVGRSYNSRRSTAGNGGPLGPQWSLSVGGGDSIVKGGEGEMILSEAGGQQTVFRSSGGGWYTAPNGDAGLSLKENGSEFTLTSSSGTVTKFVVPSGGSGGIWYPVSTEGPGGTNGSSFSYQAAEGTDEYPLAAGSEPDGIAPGPDGNLWFTDAGTSKVGKVTTSGQTTEYALPSGSGPANIAQGPDGNMWVSDFGTSKIGKIATSGQVLAEYALPAESDPDGIVVGPDGNLWFTDWHSNKIGKITTSGTILAEYSLPSGSEPWGITSGPDGNLWYTDTLTNKIGKITTSGTITEYPLPSGSNPVGIAVGPEGNIWFADSGTSTIGEIATNGLVLNEQTLPVGSDPHGIALGSDGNLWFTDYGTAKIGKMKPTGLVTEYTRPSGGDPEGIAAGPDGNLWYVDRGTSKIGMITTAGTITEPTEALGPIPSGVTCHTGKLEDGCRALKFVYSKETTAKGENESEWGQYNGRLRQVLFEAYNTSSKKVEEPGKVVAEYLYDKLGRLRAEWDPQISPALKKTYGYDEEGHVTSLTTPGQQPWLIRYGAILGDTNTGRALSVTRPGVSTALGNGNVPVNTAVPTLSSTSPVIGTTLSVSSNGTWSNSPLAYTYQWEDCNSSGYACSPVMGAVNQSYTPQASDAGYTLVARVSAQNASGAVIAATAASKVVAMPVPTHSSNFGSGGTEEGELDEPYGVAVDASGNVWVADRLNNRIDKYSSSGVFQHSYTGDSLSAPTAIAISPVTGSIYVTNQNHSRVDEFSSSGTFVKSFGSEGSGPGQFKLPNGLAVDPSGNVWVADINNNRVEEFTAGGEYIRSIGSEGSGPSQFKEPHDVTVCDSAVYVVDQGNDRIDKFSLQGNYLFHFGSGGTGNGQFTTAARIACEPVGDDVYVSDKSADRVQEFNAAGSFLEKFGSAGEGETQFSSMTGITVVPGGGIYVADTGHNRLQKWASSYSTNNPTPTPPTAGTSAISSVEYQIPVSGSGAPVDMNSVEVEKWGQKDLPVEGFAIFPPDEPRGWPTNGYKDATISYLDADSRAVNTLGRTPSAGNGISTSEYNEYNDVVRSLSADNRAAALKEAKPAESAKLLDTESTYGSEGTELLSTLGPRHLVRLANGKEVQARTHTVYSYDEGAPAEGRPYRVVTKTTQGAQIEGEAEQDVRTTVMSYSGENNLGWILHKPTSVTTDPAGLKLVHTIVYNASNGDVIETRSPAAGPATETHPTGYVTQWGAFGETLNQPEGVAIDSKGDIWVADTQNNDIKEISPTDTFMAAYGSSGTGAGQFKKPEGIAIDKEGNVWVTDTGNNRIQELSSTGKALQQIGSEGAGEIQFKEPQGIAIDKEGNVWIGDARNNRVEVISSTGKYVRAFGSAGTGNGQFESVLGMWLAIDAEGHVWVTDRGNSRVEEFGHEGTWLSTFGKAGTGNGEFKEPKGIAIDPSGHIWVVDSSNKRAQEFSSTGKYENQIDWTGAGQDEFLTPMGITTDSEGHLWITEATLTGKVEELSPTGTYIRQYPGGALDKPNSFTTDSKGNVWIADAEQEMISEYSSSGTFILNFKTSGTPKGIAVDAQGHVWVSEGNAYVSEYSSTGKYIQEIKETVGEEIKEPTGLAIYKGLLYLVDSGLHRIQEYEIIGESAPVFRTKFGGNGSKEGEFSKPQGIAVDPGGNLWIADTGNNRIQELSSEGKFIKEFYEVGTEVKPEFEECVAKKFSEESCYEAYGSRYKTGTGKGAFKAPQGITVDSTGDFFVADTGNSRVQQATQNGLYIAQMGSEGSGEEQLKEPDDVVLESTNHLYVLDTGNSRVEEWVSPATIHESFGNGGAHGAQTIYYSSEANLLYPSCGLHPEWANLLCETRPAKQPETSGLPELPVTTVTAYNTLEQPLTTTVTSGSATRTTTKTYDEAGRTLSSETTASVGKALPKVTYKHSETTGALVEVATSSESVKQVFDSLGRMTSYTDASGNTTTYEYETEKDGLLKKINVGDGTQTYSYDEASGMLTQVEDSAAGKFTPEYDVEGNLIGETYPNGIKAIYKHNQVGQDTGLVYKKETNCSSGCEWFTDSVVPSIHGQWLTQTSTLGKDTYVYDAAGRLTEATQTPAGKGCISRSYAYDEDTNRTSLTTYQPNSKSECAHESPTVETHTYDEGDRLMDAGIGYSPFGNTEKLPAADAGGSELKSSFYVDNQLSSQEQNGETIGYNLDPLGRTGEIVSTGKVVATETLHYAGPEGTPAWTSETSGKTTRNINTMNGLDAVQHGTETPVIQLSNLHGDIVATVEDSETATKLASTIAEPTEYGVPATAAPPKYSWLGVHDLPTELPSGVIAMGARSYVPQIGRFLQMDPIPGGSADAYAYVFGDPVNGFDLSGEYGGKGVSAWVRQTASELSTQEAEAYVAEQERIASEEAERIAAEAEADSLGYEESGEEWWEEEEEEEYAAYHHEAKAGSEEGDTAVSGVFYGSLGEGTQTNEGATGESQSATRESQAAATICKAGQASPCVRFVGRKKHKGKKGPKYNACEGKPNPHDQDEECCSSVFGDKRSAGSPGKPQRASGQCDEVTYDGTSPSAHPTAECAYGEEEFTTVNGTTGCTLASTNDDNGGGSISN